MAFNESLAERIRQILEERHSAYTEKRRFGGLCFLVDEKMLIGVEKNRLMARIDPEDEGIAFKKKGAKPMDFTGKVMKGYVFIDEQAVDLDKDLEFWVDLCLKYNPKAKTSNKKAGSKDERKKKI